MSWLIGIISLVLWTIAMAIAVNVGLPIIISSLMRTEEHKLQNEINDNEKYISTLHKMIWLLMGAILLMSLAFGFAVHELSTIERDANERIFECNDKIREVSEQCFMAPAPQPSILSVPVLLPNSSSTK